jgi:hypothetical protein
MQTATETTTAGFADLICSDSDWLEAEFAALVARAGLEPPIRTGLRWPASPAPGLLAKRRPRRSRNAPDTRIFAVARYPPE